MKIDDIQIKRADWKSTELFLDEPANITTAVIVQDNIYVDPSDNDFLGALFKEYVRKKMTKVESVTLNLSATDLFFYGENANVYLLNYIYNTLFPNNAPSPFNSLLQSDEGMINIGLFNAKEDQIPFLIEILNDLDINLKVILEKYMVLSFPQSLRSGDEKIFDLEFKDLQV